MGDAVTFTLQAFFPVFAGIGNLFVAEPVVSMEAAQSLDTLSDRELMERVVGGDAEAFGVLYRRHERPIFNFILRSTGQRALAEELLQETFTRAWLASRTFDPARGSFRPWLYKVALNSVRSELAKKRYAAEHVPIEDHEFETSATRTADDPVYRLDLSRRARAVVSALNTLPSYLREVVVLRCYQQLTFAEISQVTGAPEGTLKARFHRAVADLRSSLGTAGRWA